MLSASKVIVVGFDGATWDILKPLADLGVMPNLRRLMKRGAWGNLSSTIPSVTAPAWTTFATGRNPGSHGNYSFMAPYGDVTKTYPINSGHIHGKTFYEILEKNGKKNVIINLPGSFPPRAKKSIMLASFLYMGSDSVYPKSLRTEIPETNDYRTVLPDRSSFVSDDTVVQMARDLEATRFRVAKALFERKSWDFFFVMFSSTDWIQHISAGVLLHPDTNKQKRLLRLYADLDSYLGWVSDHMPAKSLLLLLSDHGFGASRYNMHMNTWLSKHNLAHIRRTRPDNLGVLPHGMRLLSQDASHHIADIFLKKTANIVLKFPWLYQMTGDMIRWYSRIAPSRWNFFPPGTEGMGLEIDNKKTLACIPAGVIDCIYINRKDRFKNGIVSAEDALHIQQEIFHGLSHLKDPDGVPAFKNVYLAGELFTGSQSHNAPDIVFESDHLTVTSLIGKTEIFEPGKPHAGCHHRDGIFLAYGDSVRVHGRVHSADLRDLGPTILEAFGIAAPSDMEGRALPGIVTRRHEELLDKIQKSKTFIGRILATYPKGTVQLTWTGGKDSTVLLWLVMEVCRQQHIPMVPVFCIDEGDMFEEVNSFIATYVKKWRLRFSMVSNKDVLKQAKKIGDTVVIRRLNAENRRAVQAVKFSESSFPFEPESLVGNHLMKTVPLLSYIKRHGVEAVFVGIRRDEHDARKDETAISKRKHPDHVRIHPILDFSEEDIWDTIRLFAIPYNKLYEQGFRSLGVKSTTQKVSSLPAWQQKSQGIRERQGRRQDKEGLMARLRSLGYM